MGMFVEHHGDSKTGICSEFVFFLFFSGSFFFLVTLPVELFFGDYVFDCFFLNIFIWLKSTFSVLHGIIKI